MTPLITADSGPGVAVGALLIAYLMGSLPNAYIIVKMLTGEDITTHGSGNVGAMNVRRTTGSWTWFAVAMAADFLKGFIPVIAAKALAVASLTTLVAPWGESISTEAGSWWASPVNLVPMAAVAGAVLGHNYSLWLGITKRRFVRTGKGLATGAGALLAYDWRYFAVVLVVGLAFIAVTRYMMAGQVAAAVSLPVTALVLHSPDWPFALLMGIVVYIAHQRRFIGMLRGQEPRFYIHDRQGPQG